MSGLICKVKFQEAFKDGNVYPRGIRAGEILELEEDIVNRIRQSGGGSVLRSLKSAFQNRRKRRRMKPKVVVGVPCYGPQEAEWWAQLAIDTAIWGQMYDLTLIVASTMAADHNRNDIVDRFLKTDAEWLFWIDADTIVPSASIQRLMGLGKTLASGLYYGKNPPHPPIAYVKWRNAYVSIERTQKWEVGNIIPVDASGMGCMLTHRSVYEDIQRTILFCNAKAADLCLSETPTSKETWKKRTPRWQGVQRTDANRMVEPTIENLKFRSLVWSLAGQRTSGSLNWQQVLGIRFGLTQVWSVDTTRPKAFTGMDYRDLKGH